MDIGREGRVLFAFRTILFSILLLLLSEIVALTAVTWSFLESASSSFAFIKSASDNRARDTIVSLAKASEVRMNPKGYSELDKTFSRLMDVTGEDADQFKVIEISLVSPDSVVLASSDKKIQAIPVKDRKKDPLYSESLYTRALRMRKWQYPDPIVLTQRSNSIEQDDHSSPADLSYFIGKFDTLIEHFFPEAREDMGLVSCAVYHESKLDVVGAIHLKYSRGNFSLFLEKQKEMYFWMVRNTSLIALAISICLILVYLLFSMVGRKNSTLSQKILESSDPNPPFIQKKVLVLEDQVESSIQEVKPTQSPAMGSFQTATTPPVVDSQSNIAPASEPLESKPASGNEELISMPLTQLEVKPVSGKKIVDAIYMGEYGN